MIFAEQGKVNFGASRREEDVNKVEKVERVEKVAFAGLFVRVMGGLGILGGGKVYCLRQKFFFGLVPRKRFALFRGRERLRRLYSLRENAALPLGWRRLAIPPVGLSAQMCNS